LDDLQEQAQELLQLDVTRSTGWNLRGAMLP
jgi:hypothetical protein